jgi:ABC-type histidine transport system ATPase subunit
MTRLEAVRKSFSSRSASNTGRDRAGVDDGAARLLFDEVTSALDLELVREVLVVYELAQ